MRVRLYQLDGRVNLALMRVAAHHRALGDVVEFRRAGNDSAMQAVDLARSENHGGGPVVRCKIKTCLECSFSSRVKQLGAWRALWRHSAEMRNAHEGSDTSPKAREKPSVETEEPNEPASAQGSLFA